MVFDALNYLHGVRWSVLEPKPNVLIQKIRKHPHMHDEEYAKRRFGEATVFAPLVLPYVQGESRRIIYKIIEYDPLLDSSDMSIKEWVQIASDIKVSKHNFCFFFFWKLSESMNTCAI